MSTIKKSPNIAVLFGLLAILTAVILVINSPRWLDWVLAVFWAGTGLLGLQQGLKK
jgi:uncharacterized membrane protein